MNHEPLGRLGPYILLEEFARGRFTRLFKAKAESLLGKIVFVKKLEAEQISPHAAGFALKREAQTLSQLSHPGIIKVFEYVESESAVYSVLEYVEGWNLQTFIEACRIKNKKIRQWFALWVLTELCRILHYLHGPGAGIAHGEIVAKNILLTSEGYLKLIDFAKAGSSEASAQRRDLFSSGALFYELLSGEKFNQERPEAVVLSEVSDVLTKVLCQESETPYPNASELYQSLAISMHLRFPGLISSDVADYLKQITA